MAQIRPNYESVVKEVLKLSAAEKVVTDSLLITSYPKTADEHKLLHQIVENDSTSEKIYLQGFRNRDLLVEKSVRNGNLELLKAHLILSIFIEGDEAMWFVENLDPMLSGPEISKICSTTKEVVEEVGKSELHLISDLIQNCESGAWSKY
ncbi:hypothetical protein [Gracilimonas sp.]|uniref:hypothetical protein n=1 Tax=Gracilimonas sp. TaxID=1974203 RepID=UPI0032EE20D5